jgi:hypothetical protein
VLPAEHLRSVGFKTVRPHHRYPRLRLELKSAVSWREDVEVALERLLGSMSPDPRCSARSDRATRERRRPGRAAPSARPPPAPRALPPAVAARGPPPWPWC